MLGSIDFIGAARSHLIIGRNPQDREQRIICHEKSNLAPNGDSIFFSIDPEQGGVIFDGFSELTANEVLNIKQTKRNKLSVMLEGAIEFLRSMLDNDGYAELSDIQKVAQKIGIGERTLYHARDDLCLQSVQTGFGKEKKSWWINPSIDKDTFKSLAMSQTSPVQITRSRS